MKNWFKNNIGDLILLLLFVIMCACVLVIVLTTENTKLKLQILEERIENTEGYYDDLIEMLEEIHYLEIDNAIYEEKIKWLENDYNKTLMGLDYDFVKQMYDDFVDFSELAFRFEGSVPDFEVYMLRHHNELYQQILLYQKLFG